MSTRGMYISLSSLTMDPTALTKECYAQARNSWLCSGCGVPKPEVQQVDVYVQERPGDKPLNICQGGDIPLIYKPFLENLPKDIVQRDLYLGRVFEPHGEQLKDWLTFRGRRRVIIRGSKHACVRKCEQCKRDVYFAMGSQYLYPEPPEDALLLESDKFGLVLPQELYAQLDIGEWPQLRIDKLLVLGEPKDGLGILANP